MQFEEIIKDPHKVSINSRTTKKGDIFIAIKGKKFDGHDFVRDAFTKGAKAAIVSRETKALPKFKNCTVMVRDTVEALGEMAKVHRRRFKIPVIGITGSSGKTTVKDMVAYVLSARFKVLKNKTSQNNLIGLPLTLLNLNRSHEICVVEMGMNHRGEIGRLSEIAGPEVGIITNVGFAHTEFLRTLGNVCRAKTELLEKLTSPGTAVLNKDDAHLGKIRRFPCRKLYFGIDKRCAYQATRLRYEKNKWSFHIQNHTKFELSLLGRHNIYNALAAICCARHFGISLATAAKRIKLFRQPSLMRLENKKIGGIEILNDSYNSNPLSMESALDTLSAYTTEGRKIAVVGDMLELGIREKFLHKSMGKKIADSPVDYVITLGRLSKYIGQGAAEKGMANHYHAKSHERAARHLKSIIKRGDVVLVKGSREMQMEKVIERLGRSSNA